MQIGPYKLTPIETGTVWLDGGAMFGTVPRVFWERNHPADEKHRIELAMRALLLEGDGKCILVDCGAGDKGDEKFRKIYNLSDTLKESLQAVGRTFEDISDVILTHLHFDHAGAATTRDESGEYRPTFPNARYHLQAGNLKTAKSPNPREKASYLPEIFEALLKHDCVNLLEGPEDLFPGIHAHVSYGHTEAQQQLIIQDANTTLFYAADLIPTSSHIPIPWIMGYDTRPLTMLEEKQKILSRAVEEGWHVFYEHDPEVTTSNVSLGKKGFAPVLE